MDSFEIYFNDLNEDAQKRLLDFVGAESAKDMNWDMDILPIAIFDVERNIEEADSHERDKKGEDHA